MNTQVITPHALPMFREPRARSTHKQAEKARKDPVKSRRPDLPQGKSGQSEGKSDRERRHWGEIRLSGNIGFWPGWFSFFFRVDDWPEMYLSVVSVLVSS